MVRRLAEMIAALPVDEQQEIELRYLELKQEVESLRELRALTGNAQADIAASLHITQPSVSKMEKQADMYLSTLRSYIEAIGGQLELIVRLPEGQAVRLNYFSEIQR